MANKITASNGAMCVEIPVTALADNGSVTYKMPSTASLPLHGAYTGAGVPIDYGAAGYKIALSASTDEDGNACKLVTMYNRTGATLTGTFVLQYVM